MSKWNLSLPCFSKIDDTSIELRETDTDKYIMEGYGKMYLLR